MTEECLEGIASYRPFRAFRTVQWSECDPAGVVYAANFYRFALWAWDLLLLDILGGARGMVQSPIKSALITHHSPARPGARLDLTVQPETIDETGFAIMVGGSSGNRAVFDADIYVVCTDHEVTHRVAIPDQLRAGLAERVLKKQRIEER